MALVHEGWQGDPTIGDRIITLMGEAEAASSEVIAALDVAVDEKYATP